MLDYFKQRIEDKNMDNKAREEIKQGSRKTSHAIFIAISGKKQTGKDTTAKFARQLLEEAGKKVESVAFADPLKEMCINILGLKKELVYGTQEDKDTLTHLHWGTIPDDIRACYGYENTLGRMTIREVLQVVGTDIFREMLCRDVWAEAPFKRDWTGTDVVILTDCRFPDEKLFTEKHGGRIIRLEREVGLSDVHASENALDSTKFHNVIDNNGSLEELYQNIRQMLLNWGLL